MVTPIDDGGSPVVAARPHHIGVVVADLPAQQAWYERMFGLVEATCHHPIPTLRTVLLVSPSGLRFELLEFGDSARQRVYDSPLAAAAAEGYHHWAIEVDNVPEAFDALVGAGAGIGKAPATGPRGAWFAYVMDPEGNPIELVEAAT